VTSTNPRACRPLNLRATLRLAALGCAFFAPAIANAQQAQSAFPTATAAENTAPANTPAEIQRDTNCGIVYLGFVGALEPAQNKASGVVQIAETLRGADFPDVCAKTFSPYVWGDGLKWLLKHFPSHSGVLSAEELRRAPTVVLVGHSMGGWAMLSVARKLSSRGIPVELTIQVDSVGISDHTVPRNVRFAVIFHAHDVLTPLTTKKLRVEDPSRTTVVANVTVTGVGHESITRDPRIRELVMKTVESSSRFLCDRSNDRRTCPSGSSAACDQLAAEANDRANCR
jgi:hypothetical protein